MRTLHAKYPGRCAACGTHFTAGTLIEWEPGSKAKHSDLRVCAAAAAAPKPPAAPPVTASLAPVAAFLTAARERGLKYPKARFLAPGGGELRLSLAGSMSKAPGSLQVKLDDLWIGRVEPAGAVVGPLSRRPDLLATLAAVATDPAKAAKEYGALMASCSFCGLALTDAGSVEVGYGPVCAAHWGLPHKPKGTPALSPVAVLEPAPPAPAALGGLAALAAALEGKAA